MSEQNIFEELGFEGAEAANLKIRADLMIELEQTIKSYGMTQARAAEFLGVTQPRISDLMNGRIGKFTIDNLVNMLATFRQPVTMKVKKAPRKLSVVSAL